MNFIQQAYKGANDLWRYFLTIVLVIIGWQIIGVIPLVLAAFTKVDTMAEFVEGSKDQFMSVGINSNLFLFAMILMFLFGLIALLLSVKFIHLRKIVTVITSRNKIDWSRVFFAFGLWSVISLVILSVGLISSPEDFVWNFKPIPFLILVLISFFFLPFQTSFEELLFRGYFMQGLGVLFKNAAFPLVITSLIFGLLHGFNPEVQKLGNMVMVYYIGTGLFLGIITLMDEGTELALGFHAANNMLAAVFITSDWMVFQTDALWIDISEPSLSMETFIPVFILYPLVIIIFSKKYGWTNWKNKLFGNIHEPVQQQVEN